MTMAETLLTPEETVPTIRTTNMPTVRTVLSAMLIQSLASVVGCSTHDVCKRSIQKGYTWAVCSNCARGRHIQYTDLCNFEREAIHDSNHCWACCGTNMGPSIVQRTDMESLQEEMKDAVISTRNGNEEVLCRMLR